MINYTPQKQLKLEFFKHPFESKLDENNRWVVLASLIPWDDLASIYCQHLKRDTGRKSVNVRSVLGALIIKHKEGLDDRGTIAMIQENIYMQYFCGLEGFSTSPIFDPSLFVDIRRRMGGEEFDLFNQRIIKLAESHKSKRARIMKKKPSDKDSDNESSASNRGTMKVDASIADQEIEFPTDLNLLNESRKHLEQMIDLLYDPTREKVKPRTYRRNARKAYLNASKKKKKSRKFLRKSLKQQLQYVFRDLKIVDNFLENTDRAERIKISDLQLLEVIRKVYDQQKTMYNNKVQKCKDRIVNIYQPYVRPIIRGKNKSKTEFGSKINISEVDGFCRIDHLSWNAYNEAGDLQMQVERFKELYGCYPAYVLADGIYLNRDNRKYMKQHQIKIVGKPLGRPPKNTKQTTTQKYYKKKKAAQRNHVEGKFGQGKRAYGLSNIRAKTKETSESWINCIFFVMNLVRLQKIASAQDYFFAQALVRLFFNTKIQTLQWVNIFAVKLC